MPLVYDMHWVDSTGACIAARIVADHGNGVKDLELSIPPHEVKTNVPHDNTAPAAPNTWHAGAPGTDGNIHLPG